MPIVSDPDIVFGDYNTPGVPESGKKKVIKGEARTLFNEMVTETEAAVAAAAAAEAAVAGVAAAAATAVTAAENAEVAAEAATTAAAAASAAAAALAAYIRFTPFQYGAIGNGVVDDGAALNLMFDAVRAAIAGAAFDANASDILIDLSGGTWRTTSSINATNIALWSLKVMGGLIIGECTGKVVLDLTNTRGVGWDSLQIYGHPTNTPSKGIYQARGATGSGFCDNGSFINCSTLGWFTQMAFHAYGAESTKHEHCTWWNYCHTGGMLVLEGFNGHANSSDYVAPITGPCSFINNNFDTCDIRYLPVATPSSTSLGNTFNISAISKAANAVVTSNGHGYANGDTVVIAEVLGMTQINNVKAVVANKTANTFELTGVNSTGFTTYTSGGRAIRANTKPTIYLSRFSQMHFDNCYAVNYGSPHVQVDWPAGHGQPYVHDLVLDILCEGAGCSTSFWFRSGAETVGILGLDLKTYNTFAKDALMIYDDGALGGELRVYDGDIKVTNHVTTNLLPLMSNNVDVKFYGVDVSYPTRAQIGVSSFEAFGGSAFAIDDGLRPTYGDYNGLQNAHPAAALTMTFATPGDLSGAYTRELVTKTIDGKRARFEFDYARTMTHTTASGALLLDGFGTIGGLAGMRFFGEARIFGIGLAKTAVATISNASPGVITSTAHGLIPNAPVVFATTGALPTGLTAGATYYVKTVLSADTFTVSTSPGGTAINTSSAGSGTHTLIKTGYTDFVFMGVQGSTGLTLQVQGNGVTPTNVLASDIPTGGVISLCGNIEFELA